MNKHFYLAMAASCFALSSFAQKPEVSISTEPRTNPLVQQELRQSTTWQSFNAQHGTWWVDFNEITKLPHRATGMAITPSSPDKAFAAKQHLTSYLGDASFPLEQTSVLEGHAGTYVHFQQKYNGLKVWFSHAQVRFDNAGRIILFGLDVYPDVAVNTSPSITATDAGSYAAAGLTAAHDITVSDLGILPVAHGTKYAYHLVYEAMVSATDPDGNAARYFTLVDAHDGTVLMRQNRVHTCGEHLLSSAPPVVVEADVTATITDNPLQPTVVRGLPHLRVNIGGTDYYTDVNGHLNENLLAPVSATVFLDGRWSEVFQGSATQVASFVTTLNAGTNTITFAGADPTEVSAYYHVNVVHDFMRTLIPAPGFTNMDFPLETNVDQPGNCNANYTGSAINFLSAGGGCPATALFNDVIYHEYGHGINYEYYDFLGGGFNNGALGEGYADVWGLMITEYPILGQGFNTAPSSFVRRYDQAPKVYPQDLVGEVHGDGEIIAGAWWDTYINLGNDMAATSALFIESHNGLAMAPDGQEGRLYRDILLDVLLADDTDANILNGTPNDNAIITAFARHGITLLANATFFHNPLDLATEDEDIDVNASMLVEIDFQPFIGDMKLFYRTHKDSAWVETAMAHVSGIDYAGQIPAQPKATIVDYYITVSDLFGNSAIVSPFLANDTNPNLPHQVLVGYQVEHLEDFDTDFGDWEIDPLGTDDAGTGVWVFETPVASYTSQFTFNETTICQTGTDHTPNNSGNLCAVTGNAGGGEAHGTNDVDDGRTTIRSHVFNLTSYDRPAFAYWRWYSNNQGANPANDVWQVFISDDQTNWVFVERTNITDRSWRRKAIRVEDYVSKTSTVSFLFVAQDSVIPSNPTFEGGSVVEAAVDDLFLYDEAEDVPNAVNDLDLAAAIFPNPASDVVTVTCDQCERDATVELCNLLGDVIEVKYMPSDRITFDVSQLESAVYTIRVQSGSSTEVLRVVVN